ncbi:MAG: O-antigen ligase family protein [Melioribacteraceae bacterium]
MLQLFLFLTLYRIASKGNSINAIPSAFVIILISIFSLISNIPSDSWSGGNAKGFMGFFSHQNSLGAIIIFLLPFLLLFIGQNYKKLNSSIPVIVASVSSFILFILLVMTSSRASILSFFVFIILFISLIDFKKSIRVFGTVFLIIMALQNITIISDFTHTLIFKGRDKFGESRFTVYSASIQSAKNGGLIGIGFGMSDKTNLHPEISIIKNNVICREKGSTILALIEEVGVIGLILFYLPFVWLIWKIIIQIKLNPTQIEPKFYLALIISLIIHQQFEAWGTGIGSPFFALFILYSSTALPLKKKGIKTGHSFLIPNISYGSTSP